MKDDLAELLSSERGRAAPAGSRDRARSGVERTLGIAIAVPGAPPPAPAAGSALAGGFAAKAAIVGAAIVAATVVAAAFRSSEPPAVRSDRPTTSTPVPVVAPPLPQATVRTTLPASAAPAPAPRPRTVPPARDTDLDAERAIVGEARSALARGDAAGALAAVSRHERQFARGRLAEERESLAVGALARAGRGEEARARAERFRAGWPGSLYGPVVDAAIRSIP